MNEAREHCLSIGFQSMKEPEDGVFNHVLHYREGAVIAVPYSDVTIWKRMREARLVELEWLRRRGLF